jgi:carbamoyltransferase
MLICGINASHTASAAFIRDGQVLSALQEERPTRIKNQSGFPEQAIKTLLMHEGLDWKDVDAWVFGGHETYSELGMKEGDRAARIMSYKNMLTPVGQLKRLLRNTPLRKRVHDQRREFQVRALLSQGVSRHKVHAIEHHRCHAFSAYYGPGADREALVITVDGAGDSLCATISIPEANGQLKRIASIDESHSIGNLWSVITALLSMVPLEHEYKLMGMAPYADGERVDNVKAIFSRAFQSAEDGSWRRARGVPDMMFSYEYWRKHLEFNRFDYICAGLQAFTEEFLTTWVKGWLQRTGRRKLRLAGGVFMNVKLNKCIAELAEVDDLFVFPSCGDETNSFGAAWAFLADQGQADQIAALKTLYLGPDSKLSDYELSAAKARELGWEVARPPAIEDAIAELLARGEVVARVSGREEFGARSLGNRAILADPSRTDVVKVVNKAIKCRDFWMPFAPSVIAEHADRHVYNPKNLAAQYMILAFDSRNTEEVRAACHPEDGTIRPQIVTRENNPSYHRVLSEFHRITGRGTILNTSLNIHGEPIVSSPEDAISVMQRSGLKNLALGPYLITKPTSQVQ